MPEKLENIITCVEASAGSGKTFALSKKYIELALNFEPQKELPAVQSIMAVTFTNKAAIEMKGRVLEYLKALARGDKELKKKLALSGTGIEKKSELALENIFANYDGFNVKTIDSFVNSVIKACAINLNISPNFQIEKNYKPYLHLAADIFIERSVSDMALNKLVLSFLNQYMFDEKPSWFPKDDLSVKIEKLFEKNSVTAGIIKSFYDSAFDSNMKMRCVALGKKIQSFSELAQAASLHKNFKTALPKVLSSKGEFLFSKELPSVYFQRDELPYLGKAQANEKLETLWLEIRKDLSEVYDYYALYHYGVYTEIYNYVSGEFHKNAAKEDLVFLSDISGRAKELFALGESVIPEIYYRLSERYKHFLVDEFQDTNNIQWSGIRRFLEESLASGGSFFYVGDAKQAIYNFRGGDPAIFLSASTGFEAYNPASQMLQTNYRSHKAIVEFNNEIFSDVNLEKFIIAAYKQEELAREVLTAVKKTYKNSAQKYLQENSKGYVEFSSIDGECEDIEDFSKNWLVSKVKGLLERFCAGDIAVLCRTNGDVSLVSEWLLEAGISVSSSQTLNIKNNPLIKEAVSFMSFISSPIDNLSFASFITGEIFTKVSGLSKAQIESFLFETGRQNSKVAAYTLFREKFPDVWDTALEKFFISAGFSTAYEFCLQFLSAFRVVQNFPHTKNYFMRLLELIKNFEADSLGLKNFLEYFNALESSDGALFIKNAGSLGVSIMTVHKAKGLEFNAVCIADLAFSAPSVEAPFLEALETGENYLLYSAGDMPDLSPRAKEVYTKEKIKAFTAELNNLYVALTRAKCEMYILAPPKDGNSKNLIPVLFGGGSLISGSQEIYKAIPQNVQTITVEPLGYKETDSNFDLKSDVKFDFALSEHKDLGKTLHYALSLIVTLKDKKLDDVLNDVGIKLQRRYDNSAGIITRLKRIIENPEIYNLFNYDVSCVYNEKTLVDAGGNAVRLDKLIIAGGKAIIIDFKSSAKSMEFYSGQMKKYISIVSEIYNTPTQCFVVDLTTGKLHELQNN